MTKKSDHRTVSRISPLIVFMLWYLCACSGNTTRNDPGLNDPGRNDPGIQKTPVYQNITAQTAYEMMQKQSGFILLDVRTEGEFRERHIPGAILIPNTELEKRAESELPDKNAVILVYCHSGARSAKAAKILAIMGYTKVCNFGGISNWPYDTVGG